MAKRKTKKASTQIVLGQDLPQCHLNKLIRTSQAYTEQVNSQRIEWPDPDTVDFDAAPEDGEAGKLLEYEVNPKGFLSNDLGIRNRAAKKGGKKGGGSGKPKLPNPKDVLAEVQKTFANIPYAGMTGNLLVGEFNGEFLDLSKAKYFREPYREMFSHFHVVFVEEVEKAGLEEIARDLSAHGAKYTAYCSTANTRNQAVGFLVHERFKVVGGPTEYMQVATVQGVPDLRPAYRLDLEDTVTGEKFSVVVLHLKSMRGGPQVTAAVRYKQLDILQAVLGPNFKGIVGGDMNFILDNPSLKDGDPLKNNGYVLFMPNDHTATQSMGSRIDGWFLKGMTRTVTFYQVRAYFRKPNVTRAFSDHALLSCQIVLCEPVAQLDPAKPNPGCSGGLTSSDFPVDVVTKNVASVNLLNFDSPDDE
jgi:endonuclease/exonuclease/phosphatase family metal-dependent hydrolase